MSYHVQVFLSVLRAVCNEYSSMYRKLEYVWNGIWMTQVFLFNFMFDFHSSHGLQVTPFANMELDFNCYRLDTIFFYVLLENVKE